MAVELKVPEVGESITEVQIGEWLKKVGEAVKRDEPVVMIETDKVTVELPSPVDGVIKEILVAEGQDVAIGSVVMKIEEGASGSPAAKKAEPQAPAATKAAPTPKPAAPKPAAQPAPAKAKGPQKHVPAAPSVRRFAREIGIDIAQVPGTGRGGRISMDDVKTYAKALNQAAAGGGGGGFAQRPVPDFSTWGEVERVKMSKIRQVTADHLSFCWQTIPHVTQFGKADITELEKLRKKYSTKDRKLTVTPFLLKVMASALKTFPQFNASVDMTTHEIVYKKFINIGVAVDTDNGLLVPVIRDVDKKTILQINDEVVAVAAKARDRKVMPDDLKGGSMTLTNLGGIGGTSFTPIVNWPEVAILGVSRGGWEPVYENSQLVPRFTLPLSLSYDHRIIDGADGARFLKWVCDAIEQPFMMELSE